MNNTTTLKTLENIKTKLLTFNYYTVEAEIKQLDNLILDIKTEILNSTATGTAKNRNKKVLSWHKKMLKTPRQVLAYAGSFKDYQVITDSYFMAFLTDTDRVNIDNATDHKLSYPNVEMIYNKAFNNNLKTFNLDFNKTVNLFNLYDYIYLDFNEHDNYNASIKLYKVIDKKVFNDLILFLNINNADDIESITAEKNQLHIKTTTGSLGILQFNRLYNNNPESIIKYMNDENTFKYND